MESYCYWPSGKDPKWIIRLQFATVNGRAECVGVEVRSYKVPDEPDPGLFPDLDGARVPITASLLRTIPLGRLIDDARRGWADRLRRQADEPWRPYTAEQLERLRRRADEYDGGGRRGYGVDHFAEVADVYSGALAAGEAPTKAVAEHFTISRSAAAKQVARARQLGLLGTTTRGKPGGIAPKGDDA